MCSTFHHPTFWAQPSRHFATWQRVHLPKLRAVMYSLVWLPQNCWLNLASSTRPALITQLVLLSTFCLFCCHPQLLTGFALQNNSFLLLPGTYNITSFTFRCPLVPARWIGGCFGFMSPGSASNESEHIFLIHKQIQLVTQIKGAVA